MKLALYRKYRPKTFADLVGQDEVREALQNAARRDLISHAYLFYGGRGSGKTTAARLVAKVINCATRQNDANFKKLGEPCNACKPCAEIDAGKAFDVIEIDAASNRGIDEIRNLKEGAQLSPAYFAKKVFIIDETHMLTREAFNALLKTLEEPPAHAVFVLATTEYDKVPATIRSRTQKFHFKRLPIAHIVSKLNSIVKTENFKASDEALELIASVAEGSLRDAESLLDQTALFAGAIDVETVERIVGRTGNRAIAEFAALLLKKDLAACLRYANTLYTNGHNVVDFNKELINYLRRALALKFDPSLKTDYAQELTKDELVNLETASALSDPALVVPLLKSFIRAYGEMRYSPITIAPFEVAVVENLTPSSPKTS